MSSKESVVKSYCPIQLDILIHYTKKCIGLWVIWNNSLHKYECHRPQCRFKRYVSVSTSSSCNRGQQSCLSIIDASGRGSALVFQFVLALWSSCALLRDRLFVFICEDYRINTINRVCLHYVSTQWAERLKASQKVKWEQATCWIQLVYKQVVYPSH